MSYSKQHVADTSAKRGTRYCGNSAGPPAYQFFSFSAFFSVPAAPYLFSFFFLSLAVCGPFSIIVISWIQRHIRRCQNIISSYTATQPEVASQEARNSNNFRIPLQAGRGQ